MSKKYTLFMVRGTGGRTMQTLLGNGSVDGNFENMVGKRLNPAVWRTVDIVYPGDQVSLQSFLNMSTTVDAGVTGLASRISELAPGQKFALCGTSQGAIVVSRVYDMIRAGELGNDDDLLAGVAFGNPRRAEGWSIPGGVEPPDSRGVLFDDLMVSPDERWWDFVNTGDLVADCPYTTDEGRAQELVFQAMFGNYVGEGSFVDEIADQFDDGLFAGLSLGLQDVLSVAGVMFEAILMGLQIPFWRNESLNSSPHIQYHLRYQNLPGNFRSAVDLAADYLNSFAGPSAGRQPSQFLSNIGLALPSIGGDGVVPDPRTAPIAAYRYLDAKRDLIDEEARSRPLIRLWDNQMRYIGTVASEMSVNAEELLHDTGQGDIVLRGDDWLVDFMRRDVRKDEDLHVTIDPFPNRRNWRWRWGGKVTNVRVKRDENGLRTVTLECAHNREHWKHLLFGATPFSDPAVQPLKAWLLPGNTRTIVSTTAFINLARNYFPLLALPTQALNPGAWTGEASNLLNLNPLNWPVQVAFVNPFLDQSRFSVIMSRWSDAHSVTEAMLRDSGCHVRAYTWLTEDDDSPHPELAAIIGQGAARPTRNCVVLSVDDLSGVTGPTGTALDGALSLIAVTADQILETIYSVDADGDGIADPFIRKLVGVAPAVPSIAFRDTEQSAIVSAEHSMFRSKASKILTGGKSPGWVNQAQTFAIKYALSELSSVITLPGTATQAPGTPGLEEIYQCVAGDTVIDGPDGKERIDILAARGGPFRVWSLMPDGRRVAATADCAFKKGTAELFTYTLDNGDNITVTARHRFLTASGFIHASDITIGDTIATDTGHSAPTLHQTRRNVTDDQYIGLPETQSLRYRQVVDIAPVGVGDYYDMHVPGWNNYLAHGMWSHNSQFDDMLLAYIQITDPVRAFRAGPYGYLEHFEQGSGSAWTISSSLTLREGHWKTRPYQGFKVSIRNGGQYSVFYDFDLGTRCHFEIDGILHTDQITAVKLHYDKDTPKTFDLSIGDDRESENPLAAATRSLATLWSAVGMLFGSGDLF